jgi:dienelactone hydrolase
MPSDLKTSLHQFLQSQARALRAKDTTPASRKDWDARRAALRARMLEAIGPMPERPSPLRPKQVGVLKREGYRIEKVVFASRPDVWVSASAYVPEGRKGRLPAVLVVHGHWAGARRDPVVQARCLGLVRLGFFVLAVDAFGAGERHPAGKGYHGALLGATLWPAGHTLLGLQVYDNRRAVDYLCSRPEVDPDRLGVTGASGGGNQTMYAGALDERLKVVVPVCSVGTYRAYLRAACCVCEVLPGALRFTEEGDVLGLVAPRALLVISATKDAFQFSVGEARKSLGRAQEIYKLYGASEKVRHATFESPHAYNQPMREAMYGWMTRWLKGEGAGKPIPEPKHTLEKPEDLACFPGGKRPAGFLFPPTFAARAAKPLLAPFADKRLDHKEAWQARAVLMRRQLADVLGDFPRRSRPAGKLGAGETKEGVRTAGLLLHPEPDLPVPVTLRFRPGTKGKARACVLLHLDGKAEALKHPLANALVDKGWAVYSPDLRGTGETRPASDAIAGAPDHNSAEHSLWVGRPLLGQWVVDVRALLDWVAEQPGLDARRLAVAGLGQAGLVALCASALLPDTVHSTAALDLPVSLVTTAAYPAGTRMGLLVPGILKVGDVPHLAALCAPRKLILAGGHGPAGKKLDAKALNDAFGFTHKAYRLEGAEESLTVRANGSAKNVAGWL